LENIELPVTNSFFVERPIGMDFVVADVQLGIRTPTNRRDRGVSKDGGKKWREVLNGQDKQQNRRSN
jgi:hypothetical protein